MNGSSRAERETEQLSDGRKHLSAAPVRDLVQSQSGSRTLQEEASRESAGPAGPETHIPAAISAPASKPSPQLLLLLLPAILCYIYNITTTSASSLLLNTPVTLNTNRGWIKLIIYQPIMKL